MRPLCPPNDRSTTRIGTTTMTSRTSAASSIASQVCLTHAHWAGPNRLTARSRNTPTEVALEMKAGSGNSHCRLPEKLLTGHPAIRLPNRLHAATRPPVASIYSAPDSEHAQLTSPPPRRVTRPSRSTLTAGPLTMTRNTRSGQPRSSPHVWSVRASWRCSSVEHHVAAVA